jgi:hypothetical protein
MERTLEAIAPDNAAGRHVRPVMRTVRVNDVNQSIFAAKNSELLSCDADKSTALQRKWKKTRETT